MTCVATESRFRLLDGYVGWDPLEHKNVAGLNDTEGLRLSDSTERLIGADLLSRHLPPGWLAKGSGIQDWYLIASGTDEIRILHWNANSGRWKNVIPFLSQSEDLTSPFALAASDRYLAVLDRRPDASSELFVWEASNGRLVGRRDLPADIQPTSLAFSPWCELAIAAQVEATAGDWLRTTTISTARNVSAFEDHGAGHYLLAFDLACVFRGCTHLAIPDPIERLAAGSDGALWAAVPFEKRESNEEVFYDLWRLYPERTADQLMDRDQFLKLQENPGVCGLVERFFVDKITVLEQYEDPPGLLAQAIESNGLTCISSNGFCFEGLCSDRKEDWLCFDWKGCPCQPSKCCPPRSAAAKVRKGRLLTLPIDSGIPRCRWHRVRVEAEIPHDTKFQIAVATADAAIGLPGEEIVEIPHGGSVVAPHRNDWQLAPENAVDFLIDQPAGRYLHVRIEMEGVGRATPVLHRVRIDFPRATSLDSLPAVYSEDSEAADFTERFLSIFDAGTEDLDALIDRFPALLNPESVPAEVLPWLGSFFGMVFDSGWSEETRRALLVKAPELFRRRGTPQGLKETLSIIYGKEPAIREHALDRAWGAVADRKKTTFNEARLNGVRLFGRSQSRFRLGSSALNRTTLRSYGNPDHDPIRNEAHRFSVLMPPTESLSQSGKEQLDRIIETQKPAHTLHLLRVGGDGFRLGRNSFLGIDTKLEATAPPVLGGCTEDICIPGTTRLGKTSILRRGRRTSGCGFTLGSRIVIGVETKLE
jgi:phage tail-like protein